jgi:sirohydrochlorin cobaltochelatase
MPTLQTALVLAAHGSHYNARSGEPARQHAAAIRRLGRFDQVFAAFWKEWPSLRDVRYVLDAAEVVVVPFFMAEGYFSRRVVPRELELDGPLTERDGARIHYTGAVGAEPTMHEVIRERVAAALGPDGPPRDETALVVVGHGTVQNRHSKETVLAHCERLRADGFAEVAAAYMEEPPLVPDIPRLVSAPNLAVVPLFVADGLHTDEDIPRDLRLERRGGGWRSPSVVDGRRIWYTSAVGNAPAMVDVVLALAEAARAGAEPA